MEDFILGLDPGSNSLGTLVRDLSYDKLLDQIVYYSVDTFDSVVVNGESLAAKRSKDKRQRRQLRVRRNRLWATLALLIKYNLCPLKQEELDAWRIYDKRRGYFRKYPINSKSFSQWIALDFNGDGIPDYKTPFEIRHLLATVQLDFMKTENRYLLGRALYHIAQHRGFKSNKKGFGRMSDDHEETGEPIIDMAEQLKQSELQKSNKLQAYMDNHSPKINTVGSAFHLLLTEGIGEDLTGPIRVRGSKYEAIRSQLQDEIKFIFNFQEGLKDKKECLAELLCDKEGSGTIFFRNPPRKSSVGTCTLEPKKKRCLESHPDFEKFRAWSFINSIIIRNSNGELLNLPLELKQMIYQKLFIADKDFQFREIRAFIQQQDGFEKINLRYSSRPKTRTINYPSDYPVSACKVTKRLIDLFGSNWETKVLPIDGKKRRGHGKKHPSRLIVYKPMDIWHQCLCIDYPDELLDYANRVLGWDDEDKIQKLEYLWNDISDKRCRLSHKAICNINYFLERGLQYSDAVFFAKIPDIVGQEVWKLKEKEIFQFIQGGYCTLKKNVVQNSAIVAITNRLIADFKTLTEDEEKQNSDKKKRFDTSINEDDEKKFLRFIENHYGKVTWNTFDVQKQQTIKENVIEEYRSFLEDSNRDFRKIPRLGDELAKIMVSDFFPDNSVENSFDKLYHPSMISKFIPIDITGRGDMRLGSPALGNIRNPVYLRAMHILRRKVNALLDAGIIPLDSTRVVIEVPREINDANMRMAYSLYQSRQQKEKECILAALPKDVKYSNDDIEKVRLLLHSNTDYINEDTPIEDKKDSKARNERLYKKWLEDGGRCYYTGEPIKLEDLGLNGSIPNVDFEHTIPRSILPDNSRKNQTLCFNYYNRNVKEDQLPALLPIYEEEISPRLQPIRDKVERIKNEISTCRSKSRRAADKEWKDYWIVRRHVWEMELDYWQGKLQRFTAEEVPESFRSSQLTDTAIVAKYASLYLKSIFHRVDVQKGSVTALFRKLYGFQEKDETKDRSNHYHHAIDAAVLTMIPTSAQRDRMIALYYEREEAKDKNEIGKITENLNKEVRAARLGADLKSLKRSVASIENKIKSSVLVNKNVVDRQLKPNKNGDSIRLDLHEKTFLGIVKTVKKEKNTKDGSVNVTRVPRPVKRVKLSKLSAKGDIERCLESIVDGKLRNYLKKVYEQRCKENVPLKDILCDIYYDFGKSGAHQPVRHVRCYKSFNYELAIPAHRHAFQRENAPSYKQYAYAQNCGNVLLLIYEKKGSKGKSLWKGRYISAFDLSKVANLLRSHRIYSIQTIDDIPKDSSWQYFDSTCDYLLRCVIKPGSRVLIKEKDENVRKLSTTNLLKRLHVIVKVNEEDGVVLCHHSLVNKYSAKQYNGKSKSVIQMKRISISSFMSKQPLFEHLDFKINPNKIGDKIISWMHR